MIGLRGLIGVVFDMLCLENLVIGIIGSLFLFVEEYIIIEKKILICFYEYNF